MRGLLLATVGALAIVLPAASASGRSFSPPPSARAWIGDWHTNQGDFRFNRVDNCQSGPENPGGSCALDGEWRKPGGNWQVILGSVSLGPKYKGEVWEGCFRLPDAPANVECSFNAGGEILLFRDLDTFTRGFWKACGLGATCASHHPIHGQKVSSNGGHPAPTCPAPPGAVTPPEGRGSSCPSYEIDFFIKVDAFPDRPPEAQLPPDLASVRFESTAARLRWNPDDNQYAARGDLTVTTTYVSALGVQDHQITISISGNHALYRSPPGQRAVGVPATVVNSDDPNCPNGSPLEILVYVAKQTAIINIHSRGDTDQECLSSSPLVWQSDRIKKAKIFRPVPTE